MGETPQKTPIILIDYPYIQLDSNYLKDDQTTATGYITRSGGHYCQIFGYNLVDFPIALYDMYWDAPVQARTGS